MRRRAGSANLCEDLGLTCWVANTNGVAWLWKNVKRKTDRDDALKLAKLTAVGELPTVAMPAKAVREWKSLIGLRKRLVGERVRGQNRIRQDEAAGPVVDPIRARWPGGRHRRDPCALQQHPVVAKHLLRALPPDQHIGLPRMAGGGHEAATTA